MDPIDEARSISHVKAIRNLSPNSADAVRRHLEGEESAIEETAVDERLNVRRAASGCWAQADRCRRRAREQAELLAEKTAEMRRSHD